METENLDIKSILQDKGYPIRDAGHEIQSVCLWRGGKNYNLSINKKTGRWFDFVEARGGNFETLLELIGGSINESSYSFSNLDFIEELKSPKKLDKSILDSLIKDHSYWENRGISRAVCENLGGGIVSNEVMPKYKDRYLLPIWSSRAELDGFTARYIGSSKSDWIPKYKHFNPKGLFVWPRDPKSIQNNTVILTESPACCMSFLTLGMNNSLCLFGITCSKSIINYLISNSVNKIIIATNNDTKHSVGQDAAAKIKSKLDNLFDNVEVRLPKLKDINEWMEAGGSDEILEYYSE